MVRVFALAVLALLAPLEGGGVMFAAKQIYLGRCAKAAWQNPYVTDGLVAMWDGEWNAGGGVHDAAATVWKDLIGNIGDMHAYSGQTPKWTDKALNMDGSFNGLYAVSSMPSPLQGSITVDGCGAFGTGEFSAAAIFSNRTSWTAGAFQYAVDAALTAIEMSANNLTVARGGRFRLPFEGSFSATVTSKPNVDFLNSRFYIGNILNGQYILAYSKIYSLRIYNRAPTADEIAANHAIDKERFKLP